MTKEERINLLRTLRRRMEEVGCLEVLTDAIMEVIGTADPDELPHLYREFQQVMAERLQRAEGREAATAGREAATAGREAATAGREAATEKPPGVKIPATAYDLHYG